MAFVAINPSGVASIVRGGSLDLDAVLTGATGTLLSGRNVTWASTNSSSLLVTANGVATGQPSGPGAEVTASSEGVTSSPVTVVIFQPRFVFLNAGHSARHTCAQIGSTEIFCWGDNLEGALGNGTVTDSGVTSSGLSFPTGITGRRFLTLSLGAGFTCGGGVPGAVLCWGAGGSNQLGNGSLTSRATPTLVNGGRQAVSVVVGSEHGCLLQADSLAYCWGSMVGEPTAVPNGMKFHTIAAGHQESCGITADTLAYCWPVGAAVGNPIAAPGGLRFRTLSLGFQHKCGIASDSMTYCWGQNTAGQVGDSTTTFRASPVPVAGGIRFVNVAAGREFTCGLTAAGAAYCWGANDRGQLGSAAGPQSTTPQPVGGSLIWNQIVAGARHACALTTASVAYCWGWNAVGQLGDGTKVDRPAPTRVVGQP